MATSEARIRANIENAQRSTGPSEAGKLISRRNSLKHGMTGSGIILAVLDEAEVETRTAEFQEQLDPKSPVGKALVRQMAVLAVRMERAASQENAAIALRVRHAVEDFDHARLDEADNLIDILGENPRANLRRLRKSPEGVDAMIAEWEDLKADLTREYRCAWTASHRERAENLTGYRIDNAGNSRIAVLSRAINGDFSRLRDEEGGHLKGEARQAWARERMAELIDDKIADLEAHFETLDFKKLDLDRTEAPARALFDPSKEATLARRYESEASRRFYKAMKELKKVEAEEAAKPPKPPTPAWEGPYNSLGSFGERPTPEPREPQPMPEVASEGPRMPVVASYPTRNPVVSAPPGSV